jgi:hypothetical protein
MQSSNENIKLPERILGIMIFVVCLIVIFEPEIRSIGNSAEDPVAAIALFPLIYLIDIGLMLPIFLAVIKTKFKLAPSRNGLLFFLILSFLYGIAVFFVRNNPVLNLGTDLRVFLGLFSGLSLVVILPNKHKVLAASITLASTAFLFIGAIILFTIPGANFMSSFERTTHPSVFILYGFPLTFVGPCIVYSTLLGDRKLKILSRFNAGMLLIIAVIILQTRSLFLATLVGIVLALITIFILSIHSKRSSEKGNLLNVPWKSAILFAVIVTALLYWWSGNVNAFLIRLAGISEYETDPGISPRLLEIPVIFESMNLSNHIFGVGLNPEPILTDWQGNPYNTSHIGILNVWWRLGFPMFLTMVFMFILFMARCVKTLARLYLKPLKYKVTAETFGLMVCWSGVATTFFISCMSGGWDLSNTLSLGLLWGIYRESYKLKVPGPRLTVRKRARFFCLARMRSLQKTTFRW